LHHVERCGRTHAAVREVMRVGYFRASGVLLPPIIRKKLCDSGRPWQLRRATHKDFAGVKALRRLMRPQMTRGSRDMKLCRRDEAH
jgi:hypothetical protein